MRYLILPCVLAATIVSAAAPQYRTLNDRLTPREYASLPDWQRHASYLREHVLASAGLIPMPDKTPLRAQIFDERRHGDYSVSKVYFESLPGFYVTGNLYKPTGTGPFPAILSPHGHWAYGRLENTDINSGPGRAINLARQGFVVFSHDMIGYNDSRQLTHDFGGKRETLWGLSLSGLQLWNSIRSVDFLESLPEVDRARIGCTGESGGGTQTFLLSAVDDRIKVAVPVNMISLHMQGGCLCENPPGLRLDTNNVEIGALVAPRPLLMVSATGDWTNETMQVEYPAMRRIYALFGAENRVHAVQFQAPHNYNRDSREAMYGWVARWLQNAAADARVAERSFTPDRPGDLLVFEGRPLPDGALTAAQLTDAWIAAAKRQIGSSSPEVLRSALLHALSIERQPAASETDRSQTGVVRTVPPTLATPDTRATAGLAEAPRREGGTSAGVKRSAATKPTVVLATENPDLQAALVRAGFVVRPVKATPFDADAAAKISHFETYNRTAASQRVADIIHTLDENPTAMLVADGEFGLPALLALAVSPVARAVIDVAQFDNASDQAFVERLYIPGLRRAGDLQTAIGMAAGPVVIHNAGDRFTLSGARIEPQKLTPAQISSALLKK
jgi:hypothetical protein